MIVGTRKANLLARLIELAQKQTGKTQMELAKKWQVHQTDISKAKHGHSLNETVWEKMLSGLSLFQFDSVVGDEAKKIIEGLREKDTSVLDRLFVPNLKHGELSRAYRMLSLRHEAALPAYTTDIERICCISTAFPLPGMGKIYEQLQRGIGQVADACKIEPVNIGGVAEYGKILKPSFADTVPVFQLFPFYLTNARRAFWGVIPYAEQKKLGVAVSKSLEGRASMEPGDFAELLRRGAAAHTVSGYAAGEIVAEMMLKLDDRELSFLSAEQSAAEWHNHEEAMRGLSTKQGWGLKNRNILLYDLAERDVVQGLLKQHGLDDFALCELKHGVNVPVGIGYSLQALPWILKHDCHEEIREKATDSVLPFADAFMQAGMKLVA